MWTSACTWSPYWDAKDPSCVKTEKRKRAWSADQTHHSSCVKCHMTVYLRSAEVPPYRLWSQTCSSYWYSQTCRKQWQISTTIHQDFVRAAWAPVEHVLVYYVWCLKSHCGFLFLLGTSSLIFCSPTNMRWDSLKSLRRIGEQISSSFLTMWTNGEPADFGPEQEYVWWDLWQFSSPFTHTETIFPESILDINTL